jgi:hypothetical protein
MKNTLQYENVVLLGFDAVQTRRYISMFWRNIHTLFIFITLLFSNLYQLYINKM